MQGQQSIEIIFSPDNWLSGVMIRPFKPTTRGYRHGPSNRSHQPYVTNKHKNYDHKRNTVSSRRDKTLYLAGGTTTDFPRIKDTLDMIG